MDKAETRRINPVSHLATFVIALVVAFELLMICGVVELRAATVSRVAPWAHNAFVQCEAYIDQKANLAPPPPRPSQTLTDFSSLIPTNLVETVSDATNVVDHVETNRIVETPAAEEILPEEEVVEPVTNAPIPSVLEEDAPVG